MTAALPNRADVAVIGAGVMGLAIAYHLAARGRQRIVVLDAHYLAWGASGRNGGGVRQQWSTEMNVRLMQESIEICAHFAEEMGINVWMRRGGYLFLARTKAAAERLEKNVTLQNRCDLPTRMISLDEARALVPELETEPGPGGAVGDAGGFVAACYNPTDAIVFPWPFLWGYAQAAERRGVTIETGAPVTAIDRRGDDFVLTTPAGTLTAGRVICAAGAWSPRVARLCGGTLPDRPVRHEILSTEPLKPFLKPMVSLIESGLYVSQSLRGELVGGVSMPEESNAAGEVRLGSRLEFLTTMARGLVALMPRLGHVKVVRQWAGPYDVSPDGNPIVGPLPGLPGFYVACGFGGHGFMMAPVVARHYAAYLDGEPPHPFFTAWRADRFGPGGAAPPAADREEMIIG
ncbi:MAG TPA: FAD-binding oxidoreductase [Polyangia bacterium]|jgi:sarcosine oxidase subunit beta|nr:FAD-binding oxidoreductase [Polyangia bacterium]